MLAGAVSGIGTWGSLCESKTSASEKGTWGYPAATGIGGWGWSGLGWWLGVGVTRGASKAIAAASGANNRTRNESVNDEKKTLLRGTTACEHEVPTNKTIRPEGLEAVNTRTRSHLLARL